MQEPSDKSEALAILLHFVDDDEDVDNNDNEFS